MVAFSNCLGPSNRQAIYNIRVWLNTSKSQQKPRLTKSGSNPSPRKAWTVVCVGLVFCSPCISGTSETCIRAKLSCPTRNWNCRIASMKGADSMSPTVPPSWRHLRYFHSRKAIARTSTIQRSGSSPELSTGIFETRSIQSWIAFVTWGTIYRVARQALICADGEHNPTWTVFPRYSPLLCAKAQYGKMNHLDANKPPYRSLLDRSYQ